MLTSQHVLQIQRLHASRQQGRSVRLTSTGTQHHDQTRVVVTGVRRPVVRRVVIRLVAVHITRGADDGFTAPVAVGLTTSTTEELDVDAVFCEDWFPVNVAINPAYVVIDAVFARRPGVLELDDGGVGGVFLDLPYHAAH